MDENTIQVIGVLANKLGTTTEYIWAVLLSQARASAISYIVVIVLFVILTALWFKFVQRKTKNPSPKDHHDYSRAEWNDQEGVFLAWASVFISCLITAIFIGYFFHEIVYAIYNPEYWALKQIIR